MTKKTKLKKLEVNSVDLVPAGANPDAHINLFKGKEERPAWDRFVDMIKKSFGMDEEEVEEVMKEHYSFQQKKNKFDMHKIENELWDYTSALRDSFSSIITDAELDDKEKENMLLQSLDEFVTATKETIPLWAKGQEALQKSFDEETIGLYKQLEIEALEDRLAVLKADDDPEDEEDVLDELDEDLDDPEDDLEDEEMEEENDMRINKSLLSAEEQVALDALIAKAAIDDEEEIEKGCKPKKDDNNAEMQKMAEQVASLEKALKMKDLENVAKSYEILGKDPEELAKSLYNMQLAGQEAYDEFINALDIAKSAKENSGLFAEIGKSRTSGGNSVQSQIAAAAAEIRKADPSLSMVQSVAKAWEQNPDLIRQYDQEVR